MLVHRTTTQEAKSFFEACKIAENGGEVVICTVPDDKDAKYVSHPNGLLFKTKEDEVWLNNARLLYKGDYDDAIPHPDGVIILRKGELILCDGGTEMPLPAKKKPYTGWISCSRGAVLVFEDELWLNGMEFLYRGALKCSAHPRGGLVIQTPDSFIWIPT
ncbi:hypothetical protein A3C89_01470 [Candidatus Kaiserbacteria bacterium RIFCSPHIGHO2_02_FULL_50_50]|uniref:Uncharacterized protein n=1 Tax=Candidatus Kaiserbacteria bacterium RIFCSPHIGHO2_02_FULL_50_50 TaxID=1798492 RepID=A0A1F6DCJ3_9BACT|nr:MAG: hypothetical protein A3C89_01470 [Candidatus Kaiserbacteria bacterium RIFCSPHIGHO2_02_FULL_50_50]OGG89312.1 MAG: hypothetical protein A3G62_01545 [Candidatus Kaiserbacteria bacterium RIFCSPLOWO2_12_FULL_50_10]